MSFKETLKAKIKLDRLLQKLLSTIREPPGKWWLDKVLTRELLDMTNFAYKKVSTLHLYVRPLEGEQLSPEAAQERRERGLYRGDRGDRRLGLLEPLLDMETSLYYQGCKDLFLTNRMAKPMVTTLE